MPSLSLPTIRCRAQSNLHDHPLCGVVYEAAQPIPAAKTNHAETSMLWRSDDSLPGPDMQLMFIHVPFHPANLSAPANSFTLAVAIVPLFGMLITSVGA